MKINTVLFVLLLTVITSAQAETQFLYKYKTAGSRDDYSNMLFLFRHLEFEMMNSARILNSTDSNIPDHEIFFKAKLCDIVDLLEDEKIFVDFNRVYDTSNYESSLKFIERKLKNLRTTINDDCEVVLEERNKAYDK